MPDPALDLTDPSLSISLEELLEACGSTDGSGPLCHQPPFKVGCLGIGRCIGAVSKRVYSFECSTCKSKWNQIKCSLLKEGDDPRIQSSTRATEASDDRRGGGYACRVCFAKKNARHAMATGAKFCKCPPWMRKMAQKLARRPDANHLNQLRAMIGLPPVVVRAYVALPTVVATKVESPIINCNICTISCIQCASTIDDGRKVRRSGVGCRHCARWVCIDCIGTAGWSQPEPRRFACVAHS